MHVQHIDRWIRKDIKETDPSYPHPAETDSTLRTLLKNNYIDTKSSSDILKCRLDFIGIRVMALGYVGKVERIRAPSARRGAPRRAAPLYRAVLAIPLSWLHDVIV